MFLFAVVRLADLTIKIINSLYQDYLGWPKAVGRTKWQCSHQAFL